MKKHSYTFMKNELVFKIMFGRCEKEKDEEEAIHIGLLFDKEVNVKFDTPPEKI